ncbi:MAG: hypothetical protein K2X11_16445, partial [Acetobacteraceae bacterium]|nr:hypothetical protein [Acetobacteraceae bacterium]
GSGEGLRDLTVAARAAWMRDHAAEVARVLAQVPVVAVASVARRPHPLVPFRGWLGRRAGPNDGLVPLSSALLPGARHVVGEARHMASIRIEGRDGPDAGLEAALEALLR